jgi:hypothetical protein
MPACPRCNRNVGESWSFCEVCGFQIGPNPPSFKPHQYVVVYADGGIDIQVRDVAEAKIALKELKLLKLEIGNIKRQVMERKRQIRADYTHRVRQPRIIFDGKLIRKVDRRVLASALAPLDQTQRRIEERRIRLNEAILDIEAFILRNRIGS